MMAASEHTHSESTNFDDFLDDLFVKHLNFSQSNLEVQVVQQLVHEMVNNIAEESFLPDSGLTVSEVIPVGSMAEGTRIMQPNEFDFMIVVEKKDADDITTIFSTTKGTTLDLKIGCEKENCIYSYAFPNFPFDVLYTDQIGDCGCKFPRLDEGMRRMSLLEETVKKIAGDGRSCSMESFPGKLRIMENSICLNGPAVKLQFLWDNYTVEEEPETMKISVDIVLVTEVGINAFFLDKLDVFHQYFYNRLKANKKVHIVNRDMLLLRDSRVSFALTEVQLLRDASETHKKCYKLLKYIYRTNEGPGYIDISSFALKNLVLQHAVYCEGGGLGWCLLKILGDLRDKFVGICTEVPFIPHIFCTEQNLLGKITSLEYLKTRKHLLIRHIKELSEFVEDLEKFRDGSPIPKSLQLLMSNEKQII